MSEDVRDKLAKALFGIVRPQQPWERGDLAIQGRVYAFVDVLLEVTRCPTCVPKQPEPKRLVDPCEDCPHEAVQHELNATTHPMMEPCRVHGCHCGNFRPRRKT